MKIRTRLTILFALLNAAILFIFAILVYFSAKESREKEFYSLLKKESITKANLFFDAKVDVEILQNIYLSNREVINEVEVAIYDTEFNLLYHDAVEIDFVKETKGMIDTILHQGEIMFFQNGWQVVGLTYNFNNETYILTSAAFDGYGYAKLFNLRKTIIIVLCFSILTIWFIAYYLSKKALEPVKDMVERASRISANNLDVRLNTGTKKDELFELASTFNNMLSRLDNSFQAQKSFVYNISHELRTPLASIITELELTENDEKSHAEYKLAIKNVLNDAKKLSKLLSNLIDLAKAGYDTSVIKYKKVRTDEIILDAQKEVFKNNSNYKINIIFENNFDEEDHIIVFGNKYLLKVAFVNLFDNSCKFSYNKQCKLVINYHEGNLLLKFIDDGIGISEEDINNIFLPFYRGKNKYYADGIGIGLYLTKKIIDIHKGNIIVESIKDKGTVFTVNLKTANA